MSEREPTADRPVMPGYGLVAGGAGLRPWSWAVERLAGAHDFWVASVNDDGTPHLAAVWAVWFEDALHLSTGGRSRKARNLRARPACSVATDDARRSLVLRGTVRRHDDPATVARVAEAYVAKYGSGFPDPDENPLLALSPTVAVHVSGEEGEFTTTATRWTFPA